MNKPSSQSSPWRGRLRRSVPLIGLVAIATLAWSLLGDYFTAQALAENRAALRGLVDSYFFITLLAFMGIYAVATASSLPGGLLLTLTGGFLFGPWVGGMAVVIAASLGACALFLIARSSVGEVLATRAGPWMDKLREGFQRDALSYLLFLRLVPAFPFWLVNLAPAFLGVPLRTYALGTFFGIMPGTLAYAFVGGGLDSLLAKQETAWRACTATGQQDCTFTLGAGDLVTIEIILAFAALGIVALIPVVLKRLRARRQAQRQAQRQK